ncbi:MAG: tetratricopeptide repeat protein [Runella sp.]
MMNRTIWLVLVLAVLLTGVLYSLPKVLVSSKDRSIATLQDSTAASTKAQTEESNKSESESQHAVSLTAAQQREAETLLQKFTSATSDPAKISAAEGLAVFYGEVRKFDSAAKYAEVVAILAPTESNMVKAGDRYYDAFSFAAASQKAEVLGAKTREWYQKALDKNPNLLNVKANLAMTYVSTDTPMQGIMLLREVLAADPTNELALFNMGVLSMRSNQYNKAIERFRQLLKSNPTNSKARFYLGVSLVQTGKTKEALEELQRVKAQEKDPTIQAAIAELEKELKQ